ncbi:MAG: EAL and HDOD domain-containing protein, partial [Pontibacterium sp.]
LPAFVNVSKSLIVDGNLPELPHKQLVFEIPGDISTDADTLKAILKLAKAGYRLALDNFQYHPRFDLLLKMVKMVKVDVSGLSTDEMTAVIERLTPFKVTPIAIKIESYDKLSHCAVAGFKLFQGHFLSRPKLVHGKKLDANESVLLRLMAELSQNDASPEELEAIIIQDPVLTFKLLRIVNSASYALVRKVESVADAIILLGVEQVTRWAALIAISQLNETPEELCRILLIRGSMCERLAKARHVWETKHYFMVGMLSGIHALLGIDQKALLAEIPISDDASLAIRRYEGPMGQTLAEVIAYETGNWDKLPAEVNSDIYETAYRESLNWANEAMIATGRPN